MPRPNSLDCTPIALNQVGGFRDALTCAAKRDDTSVLSSIAPSAADAAFRLGKGNSLTLPLSPIDIIIVGHLKRDLQEHLLNRFQNNAGNALRSSCEV